MFRYYYCWLTSECLQLVAQYRDFSEQLEAGYIAVTILKSNDPYYLTVTPFYISLLSTVSTLYEKLSTISHHHSLKHLTTFLRTNMASSRQDHAKQLYSAL